MKIPVPYLDNKREKEYFDIITNMAVKIEKLEFRLRDAHKQIESLMEELQDIKQLKED
jgi:predicted RNase H-like nuclease (RuvC/YqgF family)